MRKGQHFQHGWGGTHPLPCSLCSEAAGVAQLLPDFALADVRFLTGWNAVNCNFPAWVTVWGIPRARLEAVHRDRWTCGLRAWPSTSSGSFHAGRPVENMDSRVRGRDRAGIFHAETAASTARTGRVDRAQRPAGHPGRARARAVVERTVLPLALRDAASATAEHPRLAGRAVRTALMRILEIPHLRSARSPRPALVPRPAGCRCRRSAHSRVGCAVGTRGRALPGPADGPRVVVMWITKTRPQLRFR
jgi:hypothetical protein